METSSGDDLTQAQNELYGWIKEYMKNFQHSPSIRQMMQAMGLKSPAPIQSRLKHLQEKGYISWQEGKARTMQIVDEIIEGVPIMGSVAAGGLIETYSDVQENLDISDVLKKKNVFALTVNGDSMIDACIADGDMVLMEPITDSYSLRNGTIVSAINILFWDLFGHNCLLGLLHSLLLPNNHLFSTNKQQGVFTIFLMEIFLGYFSIKFKTVTWLNIY